MFEVKAEQWFPGKQIEGVEPIPTTIRYSLGRVYYYINHEGEWPRNWVGVEAIPGPVPQDKKDNAKNLFAPNWAEIELHDGESPMPVYHREVLPFAFWKVKAEPEDVPLDPEKEGELFKDYACISGWQLERKQAQVKRPGGGRYTVNPGDWVIRRADGSLQVMTDQEFKGIFHAANGSDVKE